MDTRDRVPRRLELTIDNTQVILVYILAILIQHVNTYRHMGIMHVHMCIHMVGLHIRTGWPAHASAGHTHIHNKMVRWVSGDGGTLLRRG